MKAEDTDTNLVLEIDENTYNSLLGTSYSMDHLESDCVIKFAETHNNKHAIGVKSDAERLLDNLLHVPDKPSFISKLHDLSSLVGYQNFIISLSKHSSKRKIISNWPAYLVEYFDDLPSLNGVGDAEENTVDENIKYFDFDLLTSSFLRPGSQTLHDLIRSSNLQSGVGYIYQDGSKCPHKMTFLFSNPSAETPMPLDSIISPAVASELATKFSTLREGAAHTSRFNISKRERECIQWISEGKTSYEISVILDLSENTINNYIANVSRKLGAVNRVHMINIAIKSGIIS